MEKERNIFFLRVQINYYISLFLPILFWILVHWSLGLNTFWKWFEVVLQTSHKHNVHAAMNCHINMTLSADVLGNSGELLWLWSCMVWNISFSHRAQPLLIFKVHICLEFILTIMNIYYIGKLFPTTATGVWGRSDFLHYIEMENMFCLESKWNTFCPCSVLNC